jgi:pyrroloquinoline quinone biosynthesis protein B
MELVLLGTAAGGGFPQWNCWCPTCRIARADPVRAHPRTQSSAAISSDGQRWFLLNASPDVHRQLIHLNGLAPAGMRHVPIEGIVPTDAELDHTLGLALLREARQLQLYATGAVLEVLREDSRLLPVTEAFASVATTELPLDQPESLRYRDGSPAGISLTAFAVPGDPPRFARQERRGHTVGLMIEGQGGGKAAFVPGCGAIDPDLLVRFSGADLLLFDGTFWSDTELVDLGIGDRTARQMDHTPISGPEGSLLALRPLPCRQKVYTHINNSNPILLEDSPERIEVQAAGLVVGDDGMRFEI